MTLAGVALIITALVLVVAEAHLSTGGLIAVGAAIAAVAGITVLLLAANVGAVVVSGIAVGFALGAGWMLVMSRRHLVRTLRARPRTGREALVGHIGVVRSADESKLAVFVDGSLWRAEPDPILEEEEELHDGDRVVVERVNGLTLRVRRAEQWELSP